MKQLKWFVLLFSLCGFCAHAAEHRGPLMPLMLQATGPVFSATPSSMDLGPSAVGVTTPFFGAPPPFAQPLQISNSGTASLTANFSFSSSEFGFDAATTLTNPVTIQAGSSVTGGIAFKPSAAGARSGQFISTDNAPGSPHTVALTGTGVSVPANDFSIVPDPAAPSTLIVPAGQTASLTVWILAGPGSDTPISFVNAPQVSGGPTGTTFSVNPGTFFGVSDSSHSRQMLTISATAPAKSAVLRGIPLLWGVTFALALVYAPQRRRNPYRKAGLVAVLACVSVLVSCGGSSSSGNANPMVISVTQQLAGQPVTHTLSVPLTVQ